MKDVLFQLSTGYRIMNPIRGLLPSSPAVGTSGVASTCDSPSVGISGASAAFHAIDMEIESSNSDIGQDLEYLLRVHITYLFLMFHLEPHVPPGTYVF